jgi:hypothetical protein
MARNKRNGRRSSSKKHRNRAPRAARPRWPRGDMAQLLAQLIASGQAAQLAEQLSEEGDPVDLLPPELTSSSGSFGKGRQAMTIRFGDNGITSTATPLTGDPISLERYFADHQMLPKGIERWSVERLEGVVQRAVDLERSEKAWRRALMLLAHHTSEYAISRLQQLKSSVPEKLGDYWQLAYDEALEWLDHEHEMRRAPTTGLGFGLQPIESGETTLN